MPALRSRNGQWSVGSAVTPTAPNAVPSQSANSEITTVFSDYQRECGNRALRHRELGEPAPRIAEQRGIRQPEPLQEQRDARELGEKRSVGPRERERERDELGNQHDGEHHARRAKIGNVERVEGAGPALRRSRHRPRRAAAAAVLTSCAACGLRAVAQPHQSWTSAAALARASATAASSRYSRSPAALVRNSRRDSVYRS